jgi:hypothetical protein
LCALPPPHNRLAEANDAGCTITIAASLVWFIVGWVDRPCASAVDAAETNQSSKSYG